MIHLISYVIGLRQLEIRLLRESDVYRRQILTSKVDPRTVRDNSKL